jgi:hypothetical protein
MPKLKDGYYMCNYCARAYKIVDGKKIPLNLYKDCQEILSHNVTILRCEKNKCRNLNNLNPKSSSYYYQKKRYERNKKKKANKK